jgi:diaminopimelate epimerase
LVGIDRADLTGVRFHKMSGSGNDFVFLDGRVERYRDLETGDVIRRLCAPGTGIGADGVVWLMPAARPAAFRMRYRNKDGSLADMCGNAALCSVRLATELGVAPTGGEFLFHTDAGTLTGRLRPDGTPEVTLSAIRDLRPVVDARPAAGETRLGFADTGVPHVVVEVEDANQVDLPNRGRSLRYDPALGGAGANVNFLSRTPFGFRMRTYERGVEGETLACGTGAAACAAVLRSWGIEAAEYPIETTSGRILLVSIHDGEGGSLPSLAGEGRIVFSGEVARL